MLRMDLLRRGISALGLVVFATLGSRVATAQDLVNIAVLGTASQSTTGFGGDASRGNDGNTNGAFGGASVSHTATGDLEPTWQVDLGEERSDLLRIKLWNRSDCCSNRLTDFRVTVLDAAAVEVFTGDFFSDNTTFVDPVAGFEIDLPVDTDGQVVRVRRLGPDSGAALFLSLAEVEVFVDRSTLPTSILESPQAASAAQGSCHRFTVVLFNPENSASITYQWQKDGDDIPGATDDNLLVSDLTDDDAGSYSVVVNADGNELVSDPAVLTVTLPNLARGGTATQINTDFGGTPERAIDGNTSGIFGNGSMTHTANTPGSFWEVALAGVSTIDEIVLWNRTECCQHRLSNFRLSILDADRVEVFGGDHFTDMSFPATPDYAVAVGGVDGLIVRIERLGPDTDGNNFVSLAEVQVFGIGPPVEPPKSLARRCGTLTSQSSLLGGFVSGLAVDGLLGNFTHTLGTDAAASWQVELTDELEIGAIVLHNRTSCCGSRLRDIVVTVLDAAGDVVYESPLLNPENELGAFPNGPPNLRVDLQFGGAGIVSGKFVQVSRIADPDLSGTAGQGNADEGNVLSLGEVEICPPVECPDEGDTHCVDPLLVEGPADGGPGAWTVTASAVDDSGDDVLYSLEADNGAGGVILLGPQGDAVFALALGLGTWTIRVTVDDSSSCPDAAADNTCSTDVVVACEPDNLAPSGVATQSSEGFGGAASRAIDCNTDGVYPNGSISHTADLDEAPWWELDLLGDFAIDRIVLWNRTDCCSERLSNMRVSLLGAERRTVWFEDIFTAGGFVDPSLVLEGVRGLTGAVVRVEALGPGTGGGAPFVSLAEVEVYEGEPIDLGVGPFVRGNIDGQGAVELTDAVFVFNFLFLGGARPPCFAAGDTNLEGQVTLTSGVYLLTFLFLGGPPPAAPFPGCASSDVASDVTLGCDTAVDCP